MLREIVLTTAGLLLLIAIDLASWALAPQRRLARSAVVAGIVVSRVAAGVAW